LNRQRDRSFIGKLDEDLDGGLNGGAGDGLAFALDANDGEEGGDEVVRDGGGVGGRAVSGSDGSAGRGGSDGRFRFCRIEDDVVEEEGETEFPDCWYRSAVRPDFILWKKRRVSGIRVEERG
jgi:hypothetical protein